MGGIESRTVGLKPSSSGLTGDVDITTLFDKIGEIFDRKTKDMATRADIKSDITDILPALMRLERILEQILKRILNLAPMHLERILNRILLPL